MSKNNKGIHRCWPGVGPVIIQEPKAEPVAVQAPQAPTNPATSVAATPPASEATTTTNGGDK